MTFPIPVCSCTDTDLIKKLLALDFTAMTAKMAEVYHTVFANADNLNAIGLTGSKSVSEFWKQYFHLQRPQKTLLPVFSNNHVVIASSHMHLAEHPLPLKTPLAKVADTRASGD